MLAARREVGRLDAQTYYVFSGGFCSYFADGLFYEITSGSPRYPTVRLSICRLSCICALFCLGPRDAGLPP